MASSHHGLVPSFKHRKLDSERAFRLIKVLPPDCDGGVRCEITHHSSGAEADVLLYKALSYTWEPMLPLHTITVNGRSHTVGNNLYQFLQVMQDQNAYDEYLWIDQLSIDQSNTAERNHQVALMGDIYKKAQGVTLWLGPGDDGGEAGLRALAEVADLLDTDYPATQANIIVHVLIDLGPADCKALGKLLCRKYWSRAWIVQEIMLAKHVTIMCGREVLALKRQRTDFNHWGHMLRVEPIRGIVYRGYDGGEQLPALNVLSWATGGGLQSSFAILLFTNFDRECSDVRDKVYALKAFAPEGLEMVVNYDWEPGQVLRMMRKAVQGSSLSPGDKKLALVTLDVQW